MTQANHDHIPKFSNLKRTQDIDALRVLLEHVWTLPCQEVAARNAILRAWWREENP